MLNMVLLAAKFAFLAVLYVFVLMVVRSAARDLKRASPAVEADAPVAAADAGDGRPGHPGPAGWSLVVESSPCLPRGWTYALQPGVRTVIGRAPEADVVLPDTFVSSRHTRVTAETGGVVVEDLGSTNGTLVGDREVEGSLFVAPGETLTIGDTVFVLEYR